MTIREFVDLDPKVERRVTRVLELSLVGMLVIGLYERNVGIIVNTALALLVAQMPRVLRRDYNISLDAGLTLWITGAVWLHALGTVGLPWNERNFYATIWWWDHVTHALSSSVVAAVGYTTVRAIDLHSEEIYLPPRFTFVFLVLFVLAFGVLWEVIEFGLAEIAAWTGGPSVLTQYGPGDTMLDLVFDTIGAVLVGIWGTAHLTDAVGIVREWLDGRSN